MFNKVLKCNRQHTGLLKCYNFEKKKWENHSIQFPSVLHYYNICNYTVLSDNGYQEQNRIETQLRYSANINTYAIHGERTALFINCAKTIVQS